MFTGFTIAIALLVWIVIPDNNQSIKTPGKTKLSLDGIKSACQTPVVWLHAVIVVCSYAGYKATDDFSLLASDALGFDDVGASSVGALGFWIRAAAAGQPGAPAFDAPPIHPGATDRCVRAWSPARRVRPPFRAPPRALP